MDAELKSMLCCPRCKSDLSWTGDIARCSTESCVYSREDFPSANGQPVLIDFDDSILERDEFDAREGGSPLRRHEGVGRWLRAIELPRNRTAERCASEILGRLAKQAGRARLLVVGGGTIGQGAEGLYLSKDVRVVAIDIYRSDHTDLVADGHKLPFADQSFDAVWIQAVLEHVLDPSTVVSEVHRVLKPDGLIFADTPLLYPVHEGAYDFTRFTVNGHRWLFRSFDCIEAGASFGAGTSLLIAWKYFVRALTGSSGLGRLATWPLLWIRLFDGPSRNHQDAASGVFFFGMRSSRAMKPREIVEFYDRTV